jgi:exonuclease III
MGFLKLIFAPMVLLSTILSSQLTTANADTECPIVYTHDDRRSDKTTLRLVQYNVEWLFVDHYSNFDCPGTQCTWKNVSEAKEHLQYVSNVVSELNPDIINFCEVEGCDELNMVIDNLGAGYKGYLKQGTDTGTGQNVGMITKIDPNINLYRNELKVSYPIAGSKCGYTGTGNTGVSKHYITEFTLDEMNIAFIAAHLIAIPTDPARCAQREGQAQVLQNIVYGYVQKGYEIIVLGDMNDYDNEVLDLNSDRPISRALDFIKGLDGEKKGLYTLTNVAIKVPQAERYTDWWDSDNNCNTNSIHDYSMIDHILVTDKVMNKIKNVFVYHGYSEYCGKMNSDHYPVVVDLNL